MKILSKYFKIVLYNEVEESVWNEFVYSSPTGYATDVFSMMLVEETEKAKNISFAVINKFTNEIVFACVLFLNNNEIIMRNGIIIHPNLSKRYQIKLSEFVISYFDEIFFKKTVKTELPALCEYNLPGKNSINPLIFYGFQPSIRYTWLVDIKKDNLEILRACEETTRQAIKKFIKNERFEFVHSEKPTQTEIDKFISLSNKTYSRNNNHAKCNQYYQNILGLNNTHANLYYIYDKTKDDIIVAAVVFIYNGTAQYSLGASSEDKPVGISKYLIYRIMCNLKEKGVFLFETGGAYPYLPIHYKQRGISDFKKCFGTFLHPIHMGEFVCHKKG